MSTFEVTLNEGVMGWEVTTVDYDASCEDGERWRGSHISRGNTMEEALEEYRQYLYDKHDDIENIEDIHLEIVGPRNHIERFKITYMKHFKLTSESIVNAWGVKLFRIELTIDCKWGKVGDKGGFVANENNLSGDAWVYGNAQVSGDARVYGDAQVFGNAQVYGDAWVYGNAWVYGDAQVSGNARVYGDAQVFGNVQVYGDARVYGNAWVSGDAWVETPDDICWLTGFGSRKSTTTFFKTKVKGVIRVACGCFTGTIKEFTAAVKKKHKRNKYAKEYLAILSVVKIKFGKN